MAKSSNMKDLLKQRMSAAQQVSEMEIGNRAYESLIDPLPVAASTIRELPVDKLRPFFTTDIGFHPYPPEQLRAFSQQLLEQGLLERIIVRSIPDSDEYEILAGHNRTAAWRMAGHDTIPAEVVAANDARAIIIATATNLLRRQELTIIERGKAYKAIRTEILSTQIVPEKREDWLSKRLSAGTQVIITNPKCVETGLDLNAFTTLIFYSMGYNLFTLRQASRRSWRINQTAPRVEVYMLYYADTMQAKAMKLMASKLAVAGLIEGTFSEEGLAAMSDVQDMTSQMAKELMLGIKDNVEDIAATFKKMAIINPHRTVKQLPEPVTVQKERVVEVPQPESVRAADTAARQVLYDGLLQASRTGRKPKHTELEDQLSMFDTAA